MRYVRERSAIGPTSLTVTTGTLAAGTVADLQETGGTTVEITEVVGAPGFDVEIGWTGIAFFHDFSIKGHYEGSASHEVRLEVYNYTTTSWDTLVKFYDDPRNLMRWWSAHVRHTDYISSGVVTIRFYHYSNGNGAHSLYIDYAAIVSGHLEGQH